MNYLEKLENKEDKTITSLELLELINIFRQREYEFKNQNKTLTKAEELRGSCIELRHDTLLDIIRDEFEEEISLQKILESTYTNSRGRKYLLFILELDQAMQILSRESKFVRKAVIQKLKDLQNRIKQLEEQINKENYLKLKIINAKTQEESLYAMNEYQRECVEPLKLENKEMKPKANYYDKVLNSTGTMTVTVMAKDLGMSAVKLNSILKKEKIQYKIGRIWVLYAPYQALGYTDIRTSTKGDSEINTTVWTQKGRKFVYDLLVKKGYIKE
ncbi:antirepressor [Fusobacterium phage Fnu1]|uniref:Antirepressor n=1 Tax=Fusobacterium phage Fnu1 TaxID=2530024 RepID=A0A481W5E6_9CAUD|nr:antirepressor [Fusobacterium phage Fnu1]QBJ04087.1 antirepressor [Fusobacterium phage Fnu1]